MLPPDAGPSTARSAAAGAGERVLVVDDETLFGRAVMRRFLQLGYRCALASTLAEAREELQSEPATLVLLDLRLPDGLGFELLEQMGRDASRPAVVMMTAHGELEDAVQAMKLGAADYVKKPIDLDELALVAERALSTLRLQQQVAYSRERESHANDAVELLGACEALRFVRERLESLARLKLRAGVTPPTVLLLGETGTGKDVAARYLHRCGPFRDRPFVQVDCASLPRELIEAELFGHEKGAYTGAQGKRVGLVEAAEDGTVFLDEIGELSLDLQAKLLNVIERRVVRRVGAVRELPVAARFVAGTNRDLRAMVDQGLFRADLYYRLDVVSVTMPPLRERGDDIVLLAHHFIDGTARRYGLEPPRLDEAALGALLHYDWPGNVRELRHLIERSVLLSGPRIGVAELGLPHRPAVAEPLPARPQAAAPPGLASMTLDQAERYLIDHALEATGGNVSEAARRLGVTRMALRYRLDKLRQAPPG